MSRAFIVAKELLHAAILKMPQDPEKAKEVLFETLVKAIEDETERCAKIAENAPPNCTIDEKQHYPWNRCNHCIAIEIRKG